MCCAETLVEGTPVVSTGTIATLNLADANEGTVRFDFGVTQGSSVSHYYDSMIGKIVVHGSSRSDAIERAVSAVQQTMISGIHTNKALLLHLLKQPLFRQVAHSIQGTRDMLPNHGNQVRTLRQGAAIVCAVEYLTPLSYWASTSVWGDLAGWSLGAPLPVLRHIEANGRKLRVTMQRIAPGSTNTDSRRVLVDVQDTDDHSRFELEVCKSESGGILIRSNSSELAIHLEHDGNATWLHLPTETLQYLRMTVLAVRDDRAHSGSDIAIRTPLPGKIAAIMVKQGDRIETGATIAVLDSMKMEHPIRSSCSGTVSALLLDVGAVVQAGTTLAVVVPE